MIDALRFTYPDHKDRFDCPDCLIHYGEKTGEYGIIIHDGGTSFLTIQFCPWCGKELSKHEETKEA
jgi:ribosomal protein S27AE